MTKQQQIQKCNENLFSEEHSSLHEDFSSKKPAYNSRVM
jgi:hypothetical protein